MNFELVILDGPEAGRRLPVPAAPITLGRAPAAAMAFPDDGFISSVHLSMHAEGDGVRITDLRSTNGTFLNDERISSSLAEVGDTIQIGTMKMQVARSQVAIAAPAPAPVYSATMPGAAPRYDATLPKELPRMDVPAPPPVTPSVAATTTIPQILVDGSEKFRRNDVAQPEAKSLADGLREKLEKVPASLFLMLNAAADESIAARLAMADVDLPKHSLWKDPGSSAPARWAPFLIPTTADAPLLTGLVNSGWGKGWISVFASSAPLEDLLEHFRKFLKVQMDGTGGIYFRFYDPQVLRQFLSTGSAAEVEMFFGPVQEWFFEADARTALVHAAHGSDGLITETLPLTER